VGTSPGGSRLIKYGGSEFAKPTFGFPEDDVSALVEQRERVYAAIFGESDTVFHELMPIVPHIDVYCFPPFGKRTFTTYVTFGMSDIPQSSPVELGNDARRVEIVFYASQPAECYSELLRRLAHFTHDNQTWLHWGHTMPNGTPPEPLFGEGTLNSLLFMPTIVQPDSDLGKRLFLGGDPVNLLWCVPVTMAECEYKLHHGIDAIYDLFDRVNHPFVYSGSRQSYV
jgi:hypothetical protein